ncbi:unnamed protein product [Dibothriocephalus latus]|uniref:Uncharacterized protein n=1 Tax=Dibothriocephalus latus TaxID=60516 RepID=A0A3P6T7K3_DIBLA|nr:unnamed protein product [Dibothriocephalus latus]
MPQLIALLRSTSEGDEIFSRNFASEQGKDITQGLLLLAGPDRTGLVNLTTLDISIEKMSELTSNCSMPRKRILRLSVVVKNARPLVTESLKSKLKVEEVAIRIFVSLSPNEVLLLLQSFDNVRNMSLDDSFHRRCRLPTPRITHELHSTWIPAWTYIQIHYASEVLDLILRERTSATQLPVLTLLTDPGQFLPKRYLTSSSNLPRILKFRVLKKPRLRMSQCCRVCVNAEERCYMPRLHCQPNDITQDGEGAVNFVACSRMSVEDNCVLHPLNVHDPYILLKIGNGKYPSIKTPNAFFAVRTELRWLVVVFNNHGGALLCHANKDSHTGLEIFNVPTFHLGNMIHTYPELYDIFWSELLSKRKRSILKAEFWQGAEWKYHLRCSS